MIRKAAGVLLLMALIIVPALGANFSYIGAYENLDVQRVTGITATSFTFDASEYDAGIVAVNFKNVNPQRVTFTLWQGDGTAHTGYIQYNRTFSFNYSETGSQILSIDGITHSWDFGDNLKANAYLSTYAVNEDTGNRGILLFEKFDVSVFYIDHYVFSPAANISDFPITKVTFTAEEAIDFGVTYADISVLRSNIQNNLGVSSASVSDQNLISTAYDLLDSFISSLPVVVMLLTIFKVIFLDHFFEVILIFESIVIAYSAATSRDFMSAGTKIVRYNRALFEAILGFLGWLVGIFHKIISAIGSLIPLT